MGARRPSGSGEPMPVGVHLQATEGLDASRAVA
jgi:hypothetical protein